MRLSELVGRQVVANDGTALGRVVDVRLVQDGPLLDSVRTAGVPPSGAIFAATAADVRDVFVGGRRVVRDGAHVSIDVAAELRAALS